MTPSAPLSPAPDDSVLLDAIRSAQDPREQLAYREALFLVTHPEAPVSTDADYPGWTPGKAATR